MRLQQAHNYTLTLVVAPAGTGKTTLLVQAIAGAPTPPAWLSLDAADDDPARFWRYFLAAIKRVAPELAAEPLGLLEGTALRVEPMLTALINAVAANGRPLLIVLDDYHLIGAETIHGGLTFLADHAPFNLSLLIASRSLPPLPLERLRVRGRLLEVGSADMRFTNEEARAMLAESLGLVLNPEVVARLVERTEGWGAGLVLAAFAARDRDDPVAFAHSFGGASPLILDYVAAEVLRGQPPEIEGFLLATAPLERLCAELCDAVTGNRGSGALLARIERSGLFLLPLDDEGRWYRYHQLFAEVLRARVARTAPEQLRATRLAAAAWFAANGLVAEAVGYAIAAEAWHEAARLIAEAGYAALLRGETTTLRGWLDALPLAVAGDYPELTLLSGWLHLVGGHIPGAAQQIELLNAQDPGTVDADELRALRAIVGVLGGNLSAGLELAGLPGENLPRAPFVRAVEAITRGLHAEFHGDAGAAVAAYSQAIRLSEQAGSLLVGFLAWCQLGEAQLLHARLGDAEASYRRADELRRRDPGTSGAVGEAAQIGLGAVAYERGEYARAELLIAAALAGGSVLGGLAAVEGQLYLAQSCAARGVFEQALQHLDEAEQQIRESSFASMKPMVDALRAAVNLRRGELGQAAAWLAEVEIAGRLPDGVADPVQLSRSRVLIALGRPDEALAVLDSLAHNAEAAGRTRTLIESLVVRAQALAAKGRSTAARAAYELAASLAAPERMVAVLGGEGAPERGTKAQTAPVAISAPAALLRGHSLTERELEVLRLIGEGLDNEAIARRLVVAPGTVKKHINRLFAKLEVSSRTQALVRARAIGLL